MGNDTNKKEEMRGRKYHGTSTTKINADMTIFKYLIVYSFQHYKFNYDKFNYFSSNISIITGGEKKWLLHIHDLQTSKMKRPQSKIKVIEKHHTKMHHHL